MLVYLADLTHTTITLSIDTFPLGIGYLAAYAKQNLPDENIEFELFRYPDDFFDAMDRRAPDVIAVSNYCWNFQLGACAINYARKKNPKVLSVMGGPNFPVDHELQDTFLREQPQLDYYIMGDGEEPFLQILKKYIACGNDREKLLSLMREKPFEYTLAYDHANKTMVRGEGFNRAMDLDSVPSPYQMGLMDKFFDGRLNPMLQTNRGCPFTCTFCLEGNSYYTKVNKFTLERIQKDLDYIAARVHPSNTLFLTDSNFGMFPRDIEIAQYIRGLQEKNGWPKSINCTTGKNNPHGIIQVVDLVNGAIRISSSVQSMDQNVLLNVRRKNIKLESYAEVQKEVRGRKLQSVADLILCLPGESKQTHFKGIKELLDTGVQRVLPYQLMLLHGTQINNKETREKFSFQTKYRVVPRNFGTYRDEHIVETEEIVVGTNTLPHEDYLDCRRFHLILEAYYKENPFSELIAYVNSCGIPTSDFFFALLGNLSRAPEDMRGVFGKFIEETEGELFPSRNELLAFMEKHQEQIIRGEVGGNLLQKYSVRLWFNHLNSLVGYAVSVAEGLLVPKAAELEMTEEEIKEQLVSIENYLKAIFVNVLDKKDIRAKKVVQMFYNVAAWKNKDFQGTLKHFYEEPPPARSGSGFCGRDYEFAMDDKQAQYVEDKIQAFGSTPQGVGKMLTRMFLKDLRRKVSDSDSEESA